MKYQERREILKKRNNMWQELYLWNQMREFENINNKKIKEKEKKTIETNKLIEEIKLIKERKEKEREIEIRKLKEEKEKKLIKERKEREIKIRKLKEIYKNYDKIYYFNTYLKKYFKKKNKIKN